jgi:hypothetical protein
MQPFIAGESDEVKAVLALVLMKTNRHALKILLVQSRGLC